MSILSQHPPKRETGLTRSIRMHVYGAAFVVFVLVVGGGGWALFTEISGAVIAMGTIVVESEVKHVQHREGGIVREILVKEGAAVAAGDLLVHLDDTMARTNYSIIFGQLGELRARRARLKAERDGGEVIKFSPRLEGEDAEKRAEIESSQALLMQARQGSLSKRKAQLNDQVLQLEKQISGMQARQAAKKGEIDILDDQLAGVRPLLEKKLVTKSRVTQLERDRTRIDGEHSELHSQMAGLQETISERQMQILQIDEEHRAEILQELQDVTSKVSELELQKVTVEDELNRLQIRAPKAGYIHQLSVHTIGGVIPAGETVLQIVPREDLLVVDAKVAPSDIDQLYVDQEALIRFPGLDHRTTPRLAARVQRIGADQTSDRTSDTQFYEVRLNIPLEELAKLRGQKLVPGMPVEAFVTTANRTVLAYLMKPIVDQIAHAMREN